MRNTIRLYLLRLRRNQPFTITGRLLALAGVFCIVAVIDKSLVSFLSYLIWMLVFAFGAGLYFRPQLQVRPLSQPISRCGDTVTIPIEITNTGRRMAYDLECQLTRMRRFSKMQKAVHRIDGIRPGATRILQFQIKTLRRGVFRLSDLQVDSLFPFAVFRFIKRYSVRSQTLVVAPAANPIPVDMAAEHLGEETLVNRLHTRDWHAVDEYVGTVDYRPGMSVRRWDFAAWARLGRPAVRQFSTGKREAYTIIAEATRARGSSDDPNLEAVLREVAGIIEFTTSRNLDTQLIVLPEESDDLVGWQEDFESLMTRLARVKGTTDSVDPRVVASLISSSEHIHRNCILVTQPISSLMLQLQMEEPIPESQLAVRRATLDEQ